MRFYIILFISVVLLAIGVYIYNSGKQSAVTTELKQINTQDNKVIQQTKIQSTYNDSIDSHLLLLNKIVNHDENRLNDLDINDLSMQEWIKQLNRNAR